MTTCSPVGNDAKGSKTIADLTTPYTNLESRHGVKVVKDMVASIDAEKRMVKLASGGELPYDRLIVSPGVDFMWETLPGSRAWRRNPCTTRWNT